MAEDSNTIVDNMTPQEKQRMVDLLTNRYDRNVRLLVADGGDVVRGRAMEARDLIKLLT